MSLLAHASKRSLVGVACLAFAAAGCGPGPSVEAGRALYKANGCGSCHGPEGHGDGPVAQTLRSPPRDLRNVTAFEGGTSEDAIATTIAYGLGPFSGMPRFEHLTGQERRSIALFVVSLRKDSETSRRTP